MINYGLRSVIISSRGMNWNKLQKGFCLNGVLSTYCTNADQRGPLHGIRILDLSRVLAGPFCTMLLGDLGAEIIKVEAPGNGDETRNWGPPFVGSQSCYFISVNRNKKSVAINMKHKKGKELIQKLAVASDVLVENFIPGKLDSFGLGYEDLCHMAPHLIYCSITGYGSNGPFCKKPGYDVIAAAVGGLIHITGPENGDPCKVGVALTDVTTGLFAHGAIMAALLNRSKTGMGQKIDCNLLSSQIASLVNIASNHLNAGTESKRWGTAHESIVPYQAFKTKDSLVIVGVGSDSQFQDLCQLMNLSNVSQDPRFSSNHSRVKNRKELIAILEKAFATKTTAEWLSEFDGGSFPNGPVNSIGEAFKHPQVLHNNMIVDMIDTCNNSVKVVGPAVQYGSGGNFCRTPPPLLGEHTEEILTYILKLPKEEIQQLKSEGVVQHYGSL